MKTEADRLRAYNEANRRWPLPISGTRTMQTSAITFRRTKPRLWQGNGFGHSPAQYAAYRGDELLGGIYHLGTGWEANIKGDRVRTFDGKLASLKAEICSRYGAAQ